MIVYYPAEMMGGEGKRVGGKGCGNHSRKLEF